MTAKAPAKGHPAKHSPAKKHPPAPGSSAKHAAHVAHLKHLHHLHVEHLAHLKAVGKPAAPAKPAKPRAFAIGDLLPVCAFEAVAQSLRLEGVRVTDDDVAGLWELCGEASIPEALDAFSLAGLSPREAVALRGEFRVGRTELRVDQLDGLADAPLGPLGEFLVGPRGNSAAEDIHALILGIDRPGSHAVLATPDGWWSWGELYSPWNARVEEAWGVSWG